MTTDLVYPRALVLFFLAAFALIIYSIPNDYEMAVLRISSFQQGAARALLEKSAKTAPNDPQLIRHLAEAYEQEGRVEQATQQYRRLVELRPRNAAYLVSYIRVLQEMGLTRESLAMKERGLSSGLIAPSHDLWVEVARDRKSTRLNSSH